MRTLLYAALSLLITVLPAGVHALVLGDEQIHSTLEEPLLLDIHLLDWEDVDLERVEVGLASREDFEAFDLPYPSHLQDLEFTVEEAADDGGAPVIRVSGSRPMVEPYLNILVSARWPGGAVLREYVVLLDLPGTAPRTPVADNGGQTGEENAGENTGENTGERGEEIAVQTAPPVSEPAEEAPLPGPGSEPEESGRRHYVVQPGDTLWSIARRFHPEGAVQNVYQTVISLHELNAGAFVNTNITLMKANQRLRIPTLAEIRGVDAELAQQIYSSRLTQGQARVTALQRGETMPEFTDFAVLGSEVIRDDEPDQSTQAAEEASVPGQEQPSPDDSGLRMASGSQDFDPVPVEQEAPTNSEDAGSERSPAEEAEEQLQEEIAMLKSLLLERENAIAALETQVASLSGQLEEAENAVSRLTSALQRARDEAGAGQVQQQEQVSGNRSIVIVGGLSGLLALLLLLAGAALFRMKQRLTEQREELDALTGAETTGPVGGYERYIDARDKLPEGLEDETDGPVYTHGAPEFDGAPVFDNTPEFEDAPEFDDSFEFDDAPEFDDTPDSDDAPDSNAGMHVDDMTYDETPAADIEEEDLVPYTVDMSNFDDDGLSGSGQTEDIQTEESPETFEYHISESPSADLQTDGRTGHGAEGEDDGIVEEIESIDFSLDDLLADLDDDEPDQESVQDTGDDGSEGEDEGEDDADDDFRSGPRN